MWRKYSEMRQELKRDGINKKAWQAILGSVIICLFLLQTLPEAVSPPEAILTVPVALFSWFYLNMIRSINWSLAVFLLPHLSWLYAGVTKSCMVVSYLLYGVIKSCMVVWPVGCMVRWRKVTPDKLPHSSDWQNTKKNYTRQFVTTHSIIYMSLPKLRTLPLSRTKSKNNLIVIIVI